ncbi:helix-turn-helix domain-containing protein [Roseateles sp. BYS78W]|uniref:Helix-turn-helix domain-containing protein n=1 Tax=Pelomonas candidula TaxID=3299025 RepID=A0ABW7H9U0_9BURK
MATSSTPAGADMSDGPDATRLAALRRRPPLPVADWLGLPPALSLRDGELQLFDGHNRWPDAHVPPLLDHLLLVVLAAAGSACSWLPGEPPQARPLPPGLVLLLPAGEAAYLRLPAEHHLLLLSLRPRLLYAAGRTPFRLRACAGRADAVIEGIARTLWAAVPHGTTGQDLGLHLGRALATHLRAHHAQAAVPERAGLSELRLRRVLDHLHARLDQPMDLTEAADVAGCSVSHFAHLFKAAMGVSPMRYLREQRMLHARELVETTRLSMCEIGLRVGIPEPAQFSQAFRAHWRTPPSQLRRQG